jgi:hypothetical protein
VTVGSRCFSPRQLAGVSKRRNISCGRALSVGHGWATSVPGGVPWSCNDDLTLASWKATYRRWKVKPLYKGGDPWRFTRGTRSFVWNGQDAGCF